MKLLLDMNMSTRCVNLLAGYGFTATHWSSLGDFQADDSVILQYALAFDMVIITFDLDFGAILSANSSSWPSVVLLRPAFAHPEDFMQQLTVALTEARVALLTGALVIIERTRIHVRPLPL